MKDIYARFSSPDLAGESQDHDHSGWLEINSFNHSIIQSKTAAGRIEESGEVTIGKGTTASANLCSHFANLGIL